MDAGNNCRTVNLTHKIHNIHKFSTSERCKTQVKVCMNDDRVFFSQQPVLHPVNVVSAP